MWACVGHGGGERPCSACNYVHSASPRCATRSQPHACPRISSKRRGRSLNNHPTRLGKGRVPAGLRQKAVGWTARARPASACRGAGVTGWRPRGQSERRKPACSHPAEATLRPCNEAPRAPPHPAPPWLLSLSLTHTHSGTGDRSVLSGASTTHRRTCSCPGPADHPPLDGSAVYGSAGTTTTAAGNGPQRRRQGGAPCQHSRTAP